jgi:hypothetical protein
MRRSVYNNSVPKSERDGALNVVEAEYPGYETNLANLTRVPALIYFCPEHT